MLWGFGLVVLATAVWLAGARTVQLIRRVRFLMLVLIVLFAFFTPGEILIPLLGKASPTLEGGMLAINHGVRLLVVVMLVAVLLQRTSESILVSGLVALVTPFAPLGMSVDRFAVRLLLVLRYVESPPEGGWRALLDLASDDAPQVAIMVSRSPLGWGDWLCLGGVLAATALGVVL